MADEIEQIIKVVTQLDPEAARRVSEELRKINDQHAQDIKQTEGKSQSFYEEQTNKRLELARKELSSMEDMLTSRYDKELDQLKRLSTANEDKYRFIVDKVRQANDLQIDMAKALTDREIEEYKRYQMNREVLFKRQQDLENKTSISDFATGQIPGQQLRDAAGRLLNFSQTGTPSTTEQDKQVRVQTEMLENVIKSRTPLEALVNIGSGLLKLAQLSYEEDLRRSKEALRSAGGTLQFENGPGGLDAAKAIRKTLEEESTVLRDNMKEVSATLTELGRARVTTFGQASLSQQKEMFDVLRTSADLLGENWSQHARRIADLSRTEIDSRTGATMSFTRGVELTNQAFITAQRVAKEMGEIDLQAFMHRWYEAADILKNYGFTVEDTTRLMARFGVELDRGVISMNDIIQFATGITKADDANRAFLFQQLIHTTERDPAFKDLNSTLKQAASQGPLAQSYLLEALKEGNRKELERIGLSAAGIETVSKALQKTQQDMADSFSGGKGGLAGTAAADFFWRQFLAPQAGTSLEGKTIEARKALIERGAAGPQDALAQMSAATQRSLDTQQIAVDAAVKMTRLRETRGGILNRVSDALGEDSAYKGAVLSPEEEAQINAPSEVPTSFGGVDFGREQRRFQLVQARQAQASRITALVGVSEAEAKLGQTPDISYLRNLDKFETQFLSPGTQKSIEQLRQKYEVDVKVTAVYDENFIEKAKEGIRDAVRKTADQDNPQDRARKQLEDQYHGMAGHK